MSRWGRALFLDCDGVLNDTIKVNQFEDRAPRSLEGFRTLPGAARALKIALGYGFRIVVVTNQPDIAKGQLD